MHAETMHFKSVQAFAGNSQIDLAKSLEISKGLILYRTSQQMQIALDRI